MSEQWRLVFLGDLVDRGPDSPGVLRLVMGMVAARTALCVPGNHDMKLMRKLRGKDVQITHGLAETLEQLGPGPGERLEEVFPAGPPGPDLRERCFPHRPLRSAISPPL